MNKDRILEAYILFIKSCAKVLKDNYFELYDWSHSHSRSISDSQKIRILKKHFILYLTIGI